MSFGNEENAHLFSRKKETLAYILWEEGNKTDFEGTGNMEILKITLKDLYRVYRLLFLGTKETWYPSGGPQN